MALLFGVLLFVAGSFLAFRAGYALGTADGGTLMEK